MLLKLQVGRVIICNRIIKLHRIGIIFDTYSASMELVIFVAKDREHYSVGDKSASYGRHSSGFEYPAHLRPIASGVRGY